MSEVPLYGRKKLTDCILRQKKTEFPGNLHDVSDEIMKVNQKGSPPSTLNFFFFCITLQPRVE